MNENLHPDRSSWMSAHYGLMCHWLFPGVIPEQPPSARTLDEAVDRFNLERFLEDIEATGADWLIFTLGQNTGKYCSPNSIIEQLAGPGHCSRRDLALEIARGLHKMGKRFIAYLPCEVAANTSLHTGFAWNNQEGSDQAEFQHMYTRAVAEWSQRFGELLDGWWFDGCYTWSIFHNQHMDWSLWYQASRYGNPGTVITFNDGSFCVGNLQPVRPEHDYLSGEVEMLVDGKIRLGRELPVRTHLPESRFVPGTTCQWHALLPVDCLWMHGNPPPDYLSDHPYPTIDFGAGYGMMESPLYNDSELGSFLDDCLGAGGAVTFNAGIYQEGHLGEETVAQFNRLRYQK